MSRHESEFRDDDRESGLCAPDRHKWCGWVSSFKVVISLDVHLNVKHFQLLVLGLFSSVLLHRIHMLRYQITLVCVCDVCSCVSVSLFVCAWLCVYLVCACVCLSRLSTGFLWRESCVCMQECAMRVCVQEWEWECVCVHLCVRVRVRMCMASCVCPYSNKYIWLVIGCVERSFWWNQADVSMSLLSLYSPHSSIVHFWG